MNQKTVLIAGIVAVAVLIGAFVVSNKPQTMPESQMELGPLYPGLEENANDVSRVELTDGESTLTVVRMDEEWGLEQKGNFPVKFDSVRRVIRDVARLEKAMEKTSNPDFYSIIQVDEPGSEGSQSKRVTLYREGGEKVADVILGKTEYGGPDNTSMQYVRKVGEETSWQVEGNVTVNVNEKSWLETQVVNIANDRPKAITVSHRDGERVGAVRQSPEDQTYELLSLPEGRELKNEFVTREFSRVLSGLRFDDVRPKNEVTLNQSDNTTSTTVTMFNGLKLHAEIYDVDGTKWTTLEASVDEDQIQTENERRRDVAEAEQLTEESAGDSEEVAPGEDAPAVEEDVPAVELVTAEDTQMEAEEMNANFSKWVYAFPSYTMDRLERRNEFYLKELSADEPEDGEATQQPVTVNPEGMTIPPSLMNMGGSE